VDKVEEVEREAVRDVGLVGGEDTERLLRLRRNIIQDVGQEGSRVNLVIPCSLVIGRHVSRKLGGGGRCENIMFINGILRRGTWTREAIIKSRLVADKASTFAEAAANLIKGDHFVPHKLGPRDLIGHGERFRKVGDGGGSVSCVAPAEGRTSEALEGFQ